MMMRSRLGTDVGALIAIGVGAAISLGLTARVMARGSDHVFHQVEHFHFEYAEHEHGDHEHGDHREHLRHEIELLVSPRLELNGEVVIDREIELAGPEGEHSGWQGEELRVRVPGFDLRDNNRRIRVERVPEVRRR